MDSDSKTALFSGIEFLTVVAPFYFVIIIKLIADGILRGSGAMIYFMITTFADLILRVLLAFFLCITMNMGDLGIWLSWPIGWTIGSVLSVIFYGKGVWNLDKLLEN